MLKKIEAIFSVILFAVVFGLVILGGCFALPWYLVNWGSFKVSPGNTLTVVGEAQTQVKSQIAIFSAGVSAVNDNKETAIAEVNQKIEKIIQAVREFGIEEKNIKTQNLNVYQTEENYYEEGRQKSRLGQWRVNNTIEIKLKEVDKASDLTDLLTKSGANNVYGPNFTVDEGSKAEDSLLAQAIENAKGKAQIMASATGRKLGKIINVTEGYQPTYSIFNQERFGFGGGGPSVMPGSQTIIKVVTVTFELK